MDWNGANKQNLLRIPLPCQSMFSVIETIVRCEDKQRLIQNTLFLQFVPDRFTGSIDAAD